MSVEETAQHIDLALARIAEAYAHLSEARAKLEESWGQFGNVAHESEDQGFNDATRLVHEAHASIGSTALTLMQADQLLADYMATSMRPSAVPRITEMQPVELPPHVIPEPEPLPEQSVPTSAAVSPKQQGKIGPRRARINNSPESGVNAHVIKNMAEEFGELTDKSKEQLSLDADASPTRVAIRQERLEKAAVDEAQRLFETIQAVAEQAGMNDVSPNELVANSYGVGQGFALLPNANDQPEGLNEVNAIKAIQDHPGDWLKADPEGRRVVFTEEAREKLRGAYKTGNGCPAIGMHVSNDGGQTRSDLFVLYWGSLAAHLGQEG